MEEIKQELFDLRMYIENQHTRRYGWSVDGEEILEKLYQYENQSGGIDEVEQAIDAWKKKNPDAEVAIELPNQCVTIKLKDVNIYTDMGGNLVFDGE